MKYKFDEYIGERIKDICSCNDLHVSKEQIESLKNVVKKISEYRFPELNGLQIPPVAGKWYVDLAHSIFKLSNSNGKVISIELLKNGYIIGGEEQNKNVHLYEDFYLKSLEEFDSESQDQSRKRIITEMVFYYGNDIIKLTGCYNSEYDYKYEAFIYVDAPHNEFDLSIIDDILEPDFVYVLDPSHNLGRSKWEYIYWQGTVGTNQVISSDRYTPTNDIFELRRMGMKIVKTCSGNYIKDFHEGEKVYKKS